MNHWMWAVSLVGILSTAVVWGTDMFFLTIWRFEGGAALYGARAHRRAESPSHGRQIASMIIGL